MAKQAEKKMKGDFTDMATAGIQPARTGEQVPSLPQARNQSTHARAEPSQRVRFGCLPGPGQKTANGLVKSRYIKHGDGQPVDNAMLENAKNSFPEIDTKLNVDHQHYEQWARVPNKRLTNTILFRGIQQLKARKRENGEDGGRYSSIARQGVATALVSRHLQSRQLAARDISTADGATAGVDGYRDGGLPQIVSMKDIKLVQRDELLTREGSSKELHLENVTQKERQHRAGTSKDKEKQEAKVSRVSLKFKYIENPEGQTTAIRRSGMLPPTTPNESGFNRNLTNIRYSSKKSEHVNESSETEQDKPNPDQDYQSKLESQGYSRSRYGTSKLRDRSPFPVSIKQPKYYGEPAYLLKEPYKHHELPKSKTKLDFPPESTFKSEYVKHDVNPGAPKVELMEFKLPTDSAMIQEEMYRSRSFMASFPSKKQTPSRTPAMVPSADFCDISQLDENRQRHSAYSTLLERTRIESAYSYKNPHMLKWVPRVQRMKDLLK